MFIDCQFACSEASAVYKSIGLRRLSVCLSACHTRALCQTYAEYVMKLILHFLRTPSSPTSWLQNVPDSSD